MQLKTTQALRHREWFWIRTKGEDSVNIAKKRWNIRDGAKLQQKEARRGRNYGNQKEKQIASFWSSALVSTEEGAVRCQEVLQNNCCVSVWLQRYEHIFGKLVGFEYTV